MTDIHRTAVSAARRVYEHHKPWLLSEEERAAYRLMSQSSRLACWRLLMARVPADP